MTEGQASNPPVPDPTILTTEALERATKAERDFVEGEIRTLNERLRGIDRATELLNETVTQTPTEIQKQIAHVRELMDERKDAITSRFDQVEKQRLEQKKDTKDAVEAALASAKETTTKTESSITEQLKQQSATFTIAIDAQGKSHDDLKTRVERIENMKQGGQEKTAGTYAAIIAGVAIISAVILIANFLTAKG